MVNFGEHFLSVPVNVEIIVVERLIVILVLEMHVADRFPFGLLRKSVFSVRYIAVVNVLIIARGLKY